MFQSVALCFQTVAVAYWRARVSYLLEVIIVIDGEEMRDTIAGKLKIIVVAVVQAAMLGLAELLLPANRRERSAILILLQYYTVI